MSAPRGRKTLPPVPLSHLGQGTVGGRKIRQTTELRSWDKAQALIREWEAEDEVVERPEEVTIEKAIADYKAELRRRRLAPETLRKYNFLFRQLEDFAAPRGLRFLTELDLAVTRGFCGTWTEGSLTSLKKLERLRTFLKFAVESNWIDENPARKIENPTVRQQPTLPFTQEEMVHILAACDEYKDCYGKAGQWTAQRVRALVLLLRYSGLRISDAVTLRRDRVVGGKLLLYTHKTSVPVYCPLPEFVVEELEKVKNNDPRFYFWSGSSTKESVAGQYRKNLARVFQAAAIPKGHPHRFRDTFAVELLLAGVPLERVSVLLGHQSLKVTEKHYAPWVRARQEQLEADVKRTWSQDPIVFSETKGTREVHEKRDLVN